MNKLTKQLIRDEGCKLVPYRDTVGKLTIGIGRNLDDNGITQDEANYMLQNDIALSVKELSQYGWFKRLDEVRQGALINMHFNLGLPRLLTFRKMIAALDAQDFKRAANEALDSRWANQVGARADRLARQLVTGEWQ